MRVFTSKIRVRYHETDQMGVVYHGNFATYLEVGRVEWLRNLNFSYAKMEKNNVFLPVVSLEIKYKKPALYDEILQIKTSLLKIPTRKIEFTYEVFNDNNTLIVTGYSALVFINRKTNRPIFCPENILDKIKTIAF